MSRPVNPWKFTGYKPGQNIQCTIIAAENDGYSVTVKKDKDILPGFLKTLNNFRIGEEVLAQYVGVQNGRILLSALFAQSATQRVASTVTTAELKPALSWQDQLEEFDKYYSSANHEEEQAPIVNNQVEPRYLFRRAIDYIMPALKEEDISTFTMSEFDTELLVSDLEGGMRTCCVKLICEENMSRSALLLYRGRVYGAIYSSKEIPQTPDWEEAIKHVVNNLFIPTTQVMVYDLPEEIVLPLSACFQGFNAPNSEDHDTRYNLDYYANWFQRKESTGLFAIIFNNLGATFLVYVYKGQFKGLYLVEEKKYFDTIDYLNELLLEHPDTSFQASAVSPSLLLNPNRHGISLSMAVRNRFKQ